MRTRTRYSIVGNTIVITGVELTIEDIRLVVNETQKVVICSSMQKDNVTVSVSGGNTVINVPTTVCTLVATDKITVEYDDCVGIAKQGSDASISLTSIDRKIGVSTETPAQTLFDAIETKTIPSAQFNQLAKQGDSSIATNTTILTTLLSGGGAVTPAQLESGLNGLKMALQGSDASVTLAALKTLIQAIPTTPISDYATETNATANKNAILAAIPTIPTDYAKQGTDTSVTLTTLNSASSAISNKIGAATDSKETASVFGKIADVKHSVENLDTSDLAKRTDVKNGSNTTIGMLENATYGLNALKNAISQGSGRIPSDQYNALAKEATLNTNTASIIGTDTTATLTALKTAIAEIPVTPISDYATETNATNNRNILEQNERDMTALIMGHIHTPRVVDYNCICVGDYEDWYHYIGYDPQTFALTWESVDRTIEYPKVYTAEGETIEVGTTVYYDADCDPTHTAGSVTAMENVLLAREETLGTPSDTSSANTIFGKIADVKGSLPSTAGLATEANATSNKNEITGKIGVATSATNDTLFKAVENINFDKSDLAKVGTDTSVTLTTLNTAVAAIPTSQVTGYALQGNNNNATNTAIDGKIGTSADATSAATVFGKLNSLSAEIPTEQSMKNLYAARAEANQDGTDTYTIVFPYTAQVTETATDIEITI